MKASTASLLTQFKALADPVRARLVALCAATECSVSELTGITGQSQPRVSQHLKQLCAVNLLERFKDGHFVYYRVRNDGATSARRRRLLALLPDDEPQFEKDLSKLRLLRSDATPFESTDADRSLYRALVELTVSRSLGDLLDIGCGQGRVLKLLASRAHRLVGVDIDSDARRLARAELLLAGLSNTTLRQGNMLALPFDDGEFDTVILDDVLVDADDPSAAIAEAKRVMNPEGRLLLLASVNDESLAEVRQNFSDWATAAGLRLAAPRPIPGKRASWLLAVATLADRATAAA
jgi:ArsR family transcriptional regulator